MLDIKIITYPNKILREPSKEVIEIDPAVKQIAKNLRYIVKAFGCHGVSAVQIGSPIRVFARANNYLNDVLINPEITWMSTVRASLKEGCLSLPWIIVNVKRSMVVKVKATTLEGKDIVFTAHGLEAQVIQHEIDHLDGIMMIERVSKLKKRLLRNKLKRIIRAIKRETKKK